MTPERPPISQRDLGRRIRSLAASLVVPENRVALIVATTAAAQMMPSGVVKGGTAMQLRLGPGGSRFSQDLDVARAGALDEFEAGYRENLRTGWAGFSGELVAKTPPRPVGVPAHYVMRPYQVRITYGTGGTPWRTVEFELGHDELGCIEDPEIEIAADVTDIFVPIGLPTPAPLPLMARHHQVVQKLHACTATGNATRLGIDLPGGGNRPARRHLTGCGD